MHPLLAHWDYNEQSAPVPSKLAESIDMNDKEKKISLTIQVSSMI